MRDTHTRLGIPPPKNKIAQKGPLIREVSGLFFRDHLICNCAYRVPVLYMLVTGASLGLVSHYSFSVTFPTLALAFFYFLTRTS